MALCTTCEGLDFAALLTACLRDCRQRQAPNCQDYDEELATPQPYQKDIFQIRDSAKTCDLCNIIFQAFERRKPSNIEDASDVPIVLRSHNNNVEVLYEVEGRFVTLCNLHWYANGGVVEKAFRGLEIVEDTRPPIHRMIHRDPKSRASYKIASRWLRNCILNHKSCESTIDGRQVPRRLLCVGDENQNPSLIETDASSQSLEWAALSYCWGDQASDKLTESSMDRFKSGIRIEDLNPTIRDAVLVTRALGLSYVWIDALCVSQEQDAREWEEEAARMDVVYGRSTVTIIAASSRSTMDGFLKERDLQYAQVPATQNSSAKIFLAVAPQSSFDVTDGPWIKRGWTLQESLLPNRMLYYTSSQMVWRCCAEHKSERGITDSYEHRLFEAEKHAEDVSYGSGWLWRQDAFTQFKLFSCYLPISPSYPIGSSLETFRLWYTLVETYSQRQFTNEDDRLMAISRLARIVGRMLKIDGYVAGLWKKDIIRGLLWYTDGSKIFNPLTQSTKPPTWSWASVGSQSISHCLSKGNYTALCKIEDVCADLVDRDEPFHSVSGGRITIRGPLKRLSGFLHGKSRPVEASLPLLERHVLKVLRTENSTHILPRYTAPSGGHFAMLQVARSSPYLHMLLLESAGGTKNVNIYKRVGVCTLQCSPAKGAASPALVKMIKESENSLAVRLDPWMRSAGWQLTGHEALKEIGRRPWDEETVIIV